MTSSFLNVTKMKNLFRNTSVALFAISGFIFFLYIAQVLSGTHAFFPVGQALVAKEFPSPGLSPLFAKPVTYLVLAFVGACITGLEAIRQRLTSWTPFSLSLFGVIAGFFAFVTGYEVLYNAVVWTALIASTQANPDTLIVAYPYAAYEWNITFATKVFSAFFFVSVYAVYFLSKVKSEVKTTLI